MPKRSWNIQLDGQAHCIEIHHERWTTKHKIFLDGKLIATGSDINPNGLAHTFVIGNHDAEIQVVSNGWVYRDILWIDQQPFLAAQDKLTDNLLKKAIQERNFWYDLARRTGLRYVPNPHARGSWRPRLVGTISGYLVSLQYAEHRETRRPLLSVLVRFASVLDLNSFRDHIKKDPTFASHLDKRARQEIIIEQDTIWAAPVLNFKTDSAQIVAERVESLIAVIAKFASTFRADQCESKACSQKIGRTLYLVYHNEMPLLFCQQCNDELPELFNQAEKEYAQVPSRIGRGILVGVDAALLGAIGWATIAILFERIAALLTPFLFAGILKAMDWAGIKRTFGRTLVAGGLAFLSIVLGLYLMLVWRFAIRVPGQSFTIETFTRSLLPAWRAFWAEPSFLGVAVFFCLLVIVPYTILVLLVQRDSFARVFQPTLQLIGEKWF